MYESRAEIDEFFESLPQFRPVRKLRTAAFGAYVLAHDEIDGTEKVFKLPRDRSIAEALANQSDMFRKLREVSHPNIVRLYELGMTHVRHGANTEVRYFLKADYGGPSLRDKLGLLRVKWNEDGDDEYCGSGNRMPTDEIVGILVDIATALTVLHELDNAGTLLCHQDVSPETIAMDDHTGQARLNDVGISQVISRSVVAVSLAGKLLYMDPTCRPGIFHVQSDIYSFGATLYEALTGELPYSTLAKQLKAAPRQPIEIVDQVPRLLNDIVMRMLAIETETRYQDASELLADACRLRARLNPLPTRYRKEAVGDDGRILCRDEETQQKVVIRLVAGGASLDDAQRNASCVERLNLPGIQASRNRFENEPYLGIVSFPPEHPNLFDWFGASEKSLDELCRICEFMAVVCDRLAALHQHGLCHGLLSPYSIVVDDGMPLLLEADSSTVLQSRNTNPDDADLHEGLQRLFPYMSPRLLAGCGPPVAADDVFSIGAVLFQTLVGRPPLAEPQRRQAASGELTREPDWDLRHTNRLIPPCLAETVIKALQFDSKLRHKSVLELAERLRACRWPDDVIEAMIADALAVFSKSSGPAELLKACEILDQALQIDPGNPSVHFAKGVVYFRNESYRFAVEEVKKAVRVRPRPEFFVLIGRCYDRWNQQYEAAVSAYREALRIAEDPLTLYRLANVHRKAGQNGEAIQCLERSIDLETSEALQQRRRQILDGWKT